MLTPADVITLVLMLGAFTLNSGLIGRRVWYCRRTKQLETHYRSYISVILSDIMLSLHCFIFLPLGELYGKSSYKSCEVSINLFLWITYFNFLSVFPLTIDRIYGVFIPFKYKSRPHMTLAWTANIVSLSVPTLILSLYHLERGEHQLYQYIPDIPQNTTLVTMETNMTTMVTNTTTSGTCLISSWVHQTSITNHVMVKSLILVLHTLTTLAVYGAIVVKLKVRGICEQHDKCTKVSIRTITMGMFTVITWLPTIIVRNVLSSQDIGLIKATQNIFYLNAIFDPIVYIFTEKVLNFVPCLNTWKADKTRTLTNQELQTVQNTIQTYRTQNVTSDRSDSLFVIPEISID